MFNVEWNFSETSVQAYKGTILKGTVKANFYDIFFILEAILLYISP